jgi:malto-oligosyltrehalose trehalohydrolase
MKTAPAEREIKNSPTQWERSRRVSAEGEGAASGTQPATRGTLTLGAAHLDLSRSAGEVREFRLWAPAQESVSVALQNAALLPMQRSPDGWFEATAPVAAGTRYQYRLADGMLVPDPASRFQPDDVHGPSLVLDSRAYPWRNPDWRGRPWCETVLYELHAGIMGGFTAVARELPRLQQLGITAIELMPVNDFPGRRNWGYDGTLPFAPDSAYGTPDDLKALVDAAHDLGLMIFLDVVYNHFGPDGNYLHHYAPQFFLAGQHTPWGPAIDFHRPEVRAFFTQNVLYWLQEYRFDGLRFDAMHAIADQSWIAEMAATVRASIEPGRHVHLVLEHHNEAAPLRPTASGQRQADAQWNDDFHRALHVLLTGETSGYYTDYADHPAEHLARCLAEGWSFQGGFARYYNAERGTPSADLPPTAQVIFLQNHDQTGNRAFGERLTTLADPAALEAAIALQLLTPHIPLLFFGEETASRTPFLFFTDHNPELAEAVRAGRRREFARFPGFADPATRERIPDPNAPESFQASIPQPDPLRAAGRTALYRSLLALRRQHLVPRLDGARSLGAQVIGAKAVRASWRLGDGATWTVACNLDAAPVPFDAPPGERLFPLPLREGVRGRRAYGREPVMGRTPPLGPLLQGEGGHKPALPGHCTVIFLDTALP